MSSFLSAWALPPGSLALLAFAGLMLLRTRRTWGIALVAASVALLYVSSLPLTEHLALRWIEGEPTPIPLAGADAIAVLGGGSYPGAPEYGRDTVNAASLERLRYAAWLHRRTGAPILVTGGNPRGDGSGPEAEHIRAVLEDEFRVPVRWIETRSRNTAENALLTRKVLAGSGVRAVFLVTHAWHMPRARWAFERAGLRVVPAPTHFSGRVPSGIEAFTPTAEALRTVALVGREIIGLAWYRLQFGALERTQSEN